MKNETPINGYDFSLKKEEIKKIFNTPDYQEYKAKARKTQKRKETIYKFTSILNSTNSVRFLIIANVILFIVSFYFLQSMFIYFASCLTGEIRRNRPFWCSLSRKDAQPRAMSRINVCSFG